MPKDHTLRKLRAVVDLLLRTMDADFAVLYAKTSRESSPPERWLRASLLQVLYSVRSERQPAEPIAFNLLYRWFVGLTLDAAVWDYSTFSANRDRLLNTPIGRLCFDRVLRLAEWQQLLSDEHFSVDGTLIEAWDSLKRFVGKDGTSPTAEDGGRNPTVDFKGEMRRNCTHAATTNPDARLYKKGAGDKSQLCFMGHALMENRQGLVVDVELTQPTGTAEREAAKAKASAIDGRTTRHAGYRTSLKRRKGIEEVFSWAKTVGGLRKTHFRTLAKVRARTVFTFAPYNLTRMGTLLGWRWSTA